MALTYTWLSTRPKLFHRLTGLHLNEFDHLLDTFSSLYFIRVIQPRVTRQGRIRHMGGGRKGAIPDIADKLCFILIYTRIYPLLVVHGMFYGMAESKACSWVGTLLPVLDAALGARHVRPKRMKGRSLEEIIDEFPELRELGILTDGVERPIRRPKEPTKQQEAFTGKKKRHTVKHVTMTHPKTQHILAVSDEHPGSHHDKRILDEQQLRCSSELDVGADSGFEGCSIGTARFVIPIRRKRKPKNQPKHVLTDEQKAYNQTLASLRVPVEHSNAGFKRNRSTYDVFRNTREGMSDMITIVAMGLHNLRVKHRVAYQKA